MNRPAPCVFAAALAIAVSGAAGQTMKERVKPQLERALAAGNSFVSVSAASGAPQVTAESLASLFGPGLAVQTAAAQAPYPTSLGGISIQVVDSAGMSQQAQLLYVSPDQINYFVPAGMARGTMTIQIFNGTSSAPSGVVQVQAVAPALFTANGNGQGVVAATAYRTVIPSSITSPVTVFQCGSAPGSCVSVPINPGLDTPVTVTLYATGIRGRTSNSAVALTIGRMTIPISDIASFAGTSPLAGVDQVTFGLPLALRGAGEVDVVLSADGVASNPGRINIE